ncbi:fluoride efflux transporter FluC [Parenemella sanctibonifatiensis]|uniref:Fluoride-specific ion channel FluC n=1 Tax=Parenemella sanctibonifatiensis TaxID=2016505 RepID=A0A255EKS9_9ACTN|nr:CrcB family protein [Parenemella sanctibonifatiensis]OYN92137.1 chromosome condensation protein CrcB [Parenemella sanctibonifatiensis]
MSELLGVLLIAVGGGIGAALRFTVDQSIPARVRERFPWGTVAVNLTGSFALGLVAGAALSDPLGAALGTGVLGGYTTFSTASLNSIRLLHAKRWLAALVAGPGMLLACTALAVAGLLLTR